MLASVLLAPLLLGESVATADDPGTSGTVDNASQILGRIPLRQLRLLAPHTPVYSYSKESVTLVFSRPVIELGSNFGDSTSTTVDVNGVHPLLWKCGATAPTSVPPVSGRTWWVTTSILRFDPTEPWGNDLECEVFANPLLRSWDGARLIVNSDQRSASFNTSALALTSTSVASEKAAAATDGAWDALLGEETSYECPSDCKLSISFSHRVDREALQHLCLMTNASWPRGRCDRVSVEHGTDCDQSITPCADSSTSWVVVPGALEFDTEYVLVLPSGVVVSNVSGPTKLDLKQSLHGLRPFQWPFFTDDDRHVAIASRQVSLYARHGLPAGALPSTIQASVQLESRTNHETGWIVHREHNDLTLQPSKTQVRLDAAFVPSRGQRDDRLSNYTFSGDQSSGLKDAFGLSLQHSEATFSTAPVVAFAIQPEAFSAFFPPGHESGADQQGTIDLVALARGVAEPEHQDCGNQECECEGVSLRAQSVSPNDQIEDILMLALVNCSNITSEHAVFNDQAKRFGPQPENTDVQNWKFGELSSSTGSEGTHWVLSQRSVVRAAWQQNCTLQYYQQPTCSLYTSASFAVSAVYQSETPRSSNEILALVTSYAGAAPIADAEVSMYRLYTADDTASECCRLRQCPCSGKSVRKVAQATTSMDGTAVFSATLFSDADSSSFVIVARHNGQVQLTPTATIYRPAPWNTEQITIIGDIIIDRALFDAGETIHATAFLRGYDWQGKDVPVPSWHPSWSHASGQVVFESPWGRYLTSVDEFGIATCNFTIPENATHGQYSITASTDSAPNISSSGISAEITVADPRHPSFVLHANTDAVVYRPQPGHNSILLNISCRSYLGELVKGATVNLAYSVGYPEYTGEYPVVLQTGEKTDLQFSLPEHVSRRVAIGSVMEITITWLDATRDLLTKAIRLPVELSDWQVELSTNPPVPKIFAGFAFRATGSVTIPDSGVPLEHPPAIRLDLLEVDQDGNHRRSDWTASARSVQLGRGEYTFTHSAEFTMPDVSHYELSARVVDNEGQEINATLQLGKNVTEQSLSVLMGWKQTFWELYLDDNVLYTIGDTATVYWYNPLEMVRVLVTWGNDGLVPRKRMFMALRKGKVNFTVPVGDECHGGCDVQAFVLVGAQPADTTLPIDQPKSQLFDLRLPDAALLPPLHLPVTEVVSTGIASVAIHAPETVLASENVTLGFSISDSKGQPVESGELAVYVVDESLIDLLPYEMPSLTCGDPHQPFGASADAVTTSLGLLSSGAAVDLALQSTEWRVSHDPWSEDRSDNGNWGVKACQGPLDITDDLWMNSKVTPITYGASSSVTGATGLLGASLTGGCGGGGGHGPPPPPGPPPAPAPAPGPAPGPAPAPPPNPGSSSSHHHKPTVRKTYKATAFFSIAKIHHGNAQVSFQMPENLGTWRVNAVATMKEEGTTRAVWREYAKATSTFVSRLPISLEPSMPLQGRVGEQFQAGCVVDVLTRAKIKVKISLLGNSSDGLILNGPKEQIVDVIPGHPLEVLWPFTVVAVGDAQVQFTAVSAAAASLTEAQDGDAFTYDLPLLSLQQPVTLASSFAMLANKSFVRWTEGFDFPAAVPKTGSVQLAAGVGHYSTQLVLARSVQEFASAAVQQPLRNWPDAFSLAAALAPPAVIATYGQNVNASSNLLMQLALRLLAVAYTDSNGLEQRPVSLLVYPTFAQLPTNVFALRVRQVVTQELAYPASIQAWSTPVATEAVSQWQSAVVSALQNWRRVPEGQPYNSWQPTPSWWQALAISRFGLGKSWRDDHLTNSSLDSLKGHAHLCEVEQQAMIALVLLEDNVTTSDRSLIQSLSTGWYANLRVQGDTAYVAGPNGASALALSTQALVLHVFALTRASDPLVQKLASYVAAGPAVGASDQRMYTFSRQVSVYVAFALAAFDRAVGSARPSLSVIAARADGKRIFNASFGVTSGSPAGVSQSYSFKQLGDTHRLQFYALGTGEASVAVSADFVPAQIFSKPVFFGLFVQKSVMLVGAGGKLSKCNLAEPLLPGQIVQVTISVTAEDDHSSGVMVYDALPAALQAQDPLLKAPADSYQTDTMLSTGEGDYNGGFTPWSWFPDSPWRWGFSQLEVFQDHVACFAPYFVAGTSECVYTAEVVTSGKAFLLPPTHAFVPTQPGVMGLSGTQQFSVAPRSASRLGD